eukprot:83927-Chlamydomonas_euryale.AAC.1
MDQEAGGWTKRQLDGPRRCWMDEQAGTKKGWWGKQVGERMRSPLSRAGHPHRPHRPHLRPRCDVPPAHSHVVRTRQYMQLIGRKACHMRRPLVRLELPQHVAAAGVKHLRMRAR